MLAEVSARAEALEPEEAIILPHLRKGKKAGAAGLEQESEGKTYKSRQGGILNVRVRAYSLL